MLRKLKPLGMIMLAGCILASPIYADQDYRQQNFFNHVSDWSATLWRSPDEKERILDQRIELRAERRRAAAEKHHQDSTNDKHYDARINDVNDKDAKEQNDNDHMHQ